MKTLNFGILLKLGARLFFHPIFFLFTLFALRKTLLVFRRTSPHSLAFYHALRSCLVLMYCCKISSPQKALSWCQTITHLFDSLWNAPLPEKTLNLRNNRLGMDYFMSLLETHHRQFFETSFFIEGLLDLTKED